MKANFTRRQFAALAAAAGVSAPLWQSCARSPASV
jgi:hypothetical protein